ncbi:MAG TPA: DUF5317 domain-containing protein [Actinomycetota bacterium]|nr:DUF5317 domain-containing protein [Actinomycetota bacterium]
MLTALVIAILAGVAARLRGGSLHELAETTFRWTPVLVAGLVVQLVFVYWDPEWLGETGGLAVVLASNAAVATWLFANRTLPGLTLAGAGMALNVLVIAANGAMPVLERSAEAAGVTRSLEDASLKHEPLDEDTALPWLGDAIPVPPFKEVLSVGDVVLALGLARVVDARMMAHRKPRHRADAAGEGPRSASG